MAKPLMTIILILLPFCLRGQVESAAPHLPDSIRHYYHTHSYNPLEYINGRDYKPYYNATKSTPLLGSNMTFGSVYINGESYEAIRIGYDMLMDELIAMPDHFITENLYIKLNKALVDSFTIDTNGRRYLFKNLIFSNNELPDGFYELAYNGQHTLIIKHGVRQIIDNGINTYVHQLSNYLIISNSIYPINRRKFLLGLFEKHQKDIKKRIRKFPVPYKKLSNYQMAELIRYIESL